MSQLTFALITSLLTVLTGVLIFVLGQIAIRLYIEPIQEQDKIVGAIHYALMFYRNKYSPTIDSKEAQELSALLRDHSSKLRAYTNAIRFYGFWSWLRFVPHRSDVLEASKAIMELSYFSSPQVDAFELTEKVARLLKLEMY